MTFCFAVCMITNYCYIIMLLWFVTIDDYLCEEIWEDEDQAIDKDHSMDGNQEVEEDIFNSPATKSTKSTSGNIKQNCLAESPCRMAAFILASFTG